MTGVTLVRACLRLGSTIARRTASDLFPGNAVWLIGGCGQWDLKMTYTALSGVGESQTHLILERERGLLAKIAAGIPLTEALEELDALRRSEFRR